MRYVVTILLLLSIPLSVWAQQGNACKDTPQVCEKELLMLRQEVQDKRTVIAQLWARIEVVVARNEELEKTAVTVSPTAPPEMSGAMAPPPNGHGAASN